MVSPNFDRDNELIHRITIDQRSRFKAGDRTEVTALCGKVWAPSFPPPKPMRTYKNCPICWHNDILVKAI